MQGLIKELTTADEYDDDEEVMSQAGRHLKRCRVLYQAREAAAASSRREAGLRRYKNKAEAAYVVHIFVTPI